MGSLGTPDGSGQFWVAGQKPARPAVRPTPSAGSVEPPPGQPLPRILFPLVLLLVMAGFVTGAHVRGRTDLLSALRPPLEVRTQPPGASVYINGRLAGASPLRILALPAGEYTIRLERDGCEPVVKKVDLKSGGSELRETLPELAVGRLRVAIEPDGAEVLLDGETIGVTPLQHDRIPTGQHELVVRKTNFEAFATRIDVQPGELVEYKDFPLRDKILVMLRRGIEAEPQRVSHYVDMGHYLFVNDELEESAKYYAKALSVAATPLKLPDDLPQAEKDLEFRLRSEDTQRMNDELRKKENWPGKDVALFKTKIEEAQDQVAREHIEHWGWVKQAADGFLRRNKLERAEDLYIRHLAAAVKGADLAGPLQGLLVVRLRQHNLSGARETFIRYAETCAKRPDVLRQCSREIFQLHNQFRDQERAEVLGMAERLGRLAHAGCPKGELKTLCAFELGQVVRALERFDDAALLFKEAAEGANDDSIREQRLLERAQCLLRGQDLPAARAAFEALAKSPRENIQRGAEQGLKNVAAREAKAQKK